MKQFKQLINGELVLGESSILDVYNPVNDTVIASINKASKKQATDALESAQEAFLSWSKTSLDEKEKVTNNFIKILNENREDVISLLIEETGKTRSVAEYDFDMLPNCLHFFIEEAKRLNGSIIPDYQAKHLSMTIRKPVGVVVGYLAWNFPLLNLGYKLGPILASGCTCVLKPSSHTPLATMMIGELAMIAGVPKGVINILVGSGSEIAETLSSSEIPKMLTLIGSSNTGRKIIEQSATSIKHFSLELGGNAPVMVLKDADVKAAAFNTFDGKFANSGQVCVAPNRVFVHKDIKADFIKEVQKLMKNLVLRSDNKIEDGQYELAPLVSKDAVNYMKELVDDALSKGAKIIAGGKKSERSGYFYEGTVLDGVNKSMKIYNNEIFGPIMSLVDFDDTDDLTALANDTEYGLAAYVYTKDLELALNLGQNIDSGNVCINEPFYEYNLPHGGCKESGLGKDCSTFSLEEYFYVQRVSIKL